MIGCFCCSSKMTNSVIPLKIVDSESSHNSCIATSVERKSRFVMLVKVTDKTTKVVIDALIRQSKKLPAELYKSLTLDRGSEQAGHERFIVATDIPVYFCDTSSPWQCNHPISHKYHPSPLGKKHNL